MNEQHYRGDPADLIDAARSLLAGCVPEWHRDAACLTHPERDWFSTRADSLEVTLAICGQCPVMVTCRAEAIAREEWWGCWGGLDQDALRAAVRLHRKRSRSFARKAEPT